MALSLTDRLKDMFGRDKTTAAVEEAFAVIAKNAWVSSQLPPKNAFTTTIVLRAAGYLHEADILKAAEYGDVKHQKHKKRRNGTYKPIEEPLDLPTIVKSFGHTLPTTFRIWEDSKEPASLTVGYWWLDAVQRRGVGGHLTPRQWEKLCKWAATEFRKQVSLVAADHEAFMDPAALAMAASLCAKLRHLANRSLLGLRPHMCRILATRAELEDGLVLLMTKQTDAGIWPKYFPLFNYPQKKEKGGGGSNYCFTFEMLEAVLDSFGADDVEFCERETVFKGFQKAVKWCRGNRLRYTHRNRTYSGWNSGGQVQTLAMGKPESWATAVVHMFLWELQDVLSRRIQKRLESQYDIGHIKRDRKAWAKLLDIDITLKGDESTTVKKLFKEDIIKHAFDYKTPIALVRTPMKGARSALLFGPPGTSKTSIASALAKTLEWPLLRLDPSKFLSDGLERIYTRANEIFTDLMDLSRVVVLFDEMDALVRSRESDQDKRKRATGPLDMTSQFLTTCMLPKLADLHERARVVFLMATNHRQGFDPAIMRPGRFDLLVCVKPPTWNAKLKGLHIFFRDIEKTKAGKGPAKTESEFKNEAKAAKPVLREFVKGFKKEALDLFTYGDFKQVISWLKSNGKSLAEALNDIGRDEFRKRLIAFGSYAWFAPDKKGRNPAFVEYEEDKGETRRQI